MAAEETVRYYQGPEDLAEEIYRLLPPELEILSRTGLRKLVALAYRVSLMKDEGRYPCFQILVPQFSYQSAGLTIRFRTPLMLDLDTLHRLAPGVPQRPFAFFVEEDENGDLRGLGIGRAEASILALMGSGEEDWVHTRPWGMSLYITGPGQMMISVIIKDENGVPGVRFLSISNGGIRSVNQFNAGWLEVGFGIHHPVSMLWPKILTEVQAFGHGGMFVILPSGVSVNDVRGVLDVYHRTSEPDLGVLFDRLLEERSKESERALCDALWTVAQLSVVDGCVVFNSTMQLQGFAAEVNVHDEHLPDAVLIKIQPPRDSEIVPVNLKNFGTRHRSAARICSRLGARVFVVSQDGAIRAFERLYDGRVSIRGPFACGPGLSPDPLSGMFLDIRGREFFEQTYL